MSLSLLVVGAAQAGAIVAPSAVPSVAQMASHADLLAELDGLPIAFERNEGQADPEVRYLSRGAGYHVTFTSRGADLVLRAGADAKPSTIRIRMVNGRKGVEPVASEALPGIVNYLIGDDPARHVVDVGTFARVAYASVYPGIDLVYYGRAGRLEYDLVVAPKADPRRIRIAFDGTSGLALTADGDLVVRTESGDVEMRKPVAYQNVGGVRRDVDAGFVLAGTRQIGFRIGAYDPAHALVIDPVLVLATTLWGSTAGVALDATRSIYVVGTLTSAALPATGGYQTQLAGTQDAYVAKLNATGTAVVYATYLGARRAATSGLGIAVDASGSAYVTGTTTGSGFPVTPSAYRTSGSTFVTKLSPAGNALAYSTFVTAPVAALVVDGGGNVFMTGSSGMLETTPGAFQSTGGGTNAYVAKLNAGGSAMAYATLLGGSADDAGKGIAVDSGGNAYVVGVTRSADFPTRNALRTSLAGTTDSFVTKLNATGAALVYSTYLGGSADERGFAIAVDAAGQAHVTGWTNSADFPRTAGAFQPAIGHVDPAVTNAFVTKLNAAGNGLVYSSYLGGAWCLTATVHACLGFFGPDEGIDVGTSIAVDAAGYAYVGGYATSTEFPLVDSTQVMGLVGDVWRAPFIARIAPGGERIVYAAVLGPKIQDGNASQIAIDNVGGVVVAGYTQPFPLTPGAVLGSGTGILFKLSNGKYPTRVASSANPVGRGQTVTLNATVLTPTPAGTVTFRDGASILGTVNATQGSASLTVTLPPGVHRITATNSADGLASPPHFQIVRGQ